MIEALLWWCGLCAFLVVAVAVWTAVGCRRDDEAYRWRAWSLYGVVLDRHGRELGRRQGDEDYGSALARLERAKTEVVGR